MQFRSFCYWFLFLTEFVRFHLVSLLVSLFLLSPFFVSKNSPLDLILCSRLMILLLCQNITKITPPPDSEPRVFSFSFTPCFIVPFKSFSLFPRFCFQKSPPLDLILCTRLMMDVAFMSEYFKIQTASHDKVKMRFKSISFSLSLSSNGT